MVRALWGSALIVGSIALIVAASKTAAEYGSLEERKGVTLCEDPGQSLRHLLKKQNVSELIFNALNDEDLDALTTALANATKGDLTQENGHGEQPIHVAAKVGNPGLIQLLLDAGSDIEARSNAGDATPLQVAFKEDQKVAALVLLDNGANPDVTDKEGSPLIHLAVARGETYFLQMLLEAGVDPDSTDSFGNSALHWAVFDGNPTAISSLASSGANIDATDDAGMTPLMLAVQSNATLSFDHLLSYSANMSIQDNNGFTALHIATQKGIEPFVVKLLDNNAPVNATSSQNVSAMHLASLRDEGYGIMHALVDAGADVNVLSAELGSPLHWAYFWGNVRNLEVLFDGGGDLDVMNAAGKFPEELECGCVDGVNITELPKLDHPVICSENCRTDGIIDVIEIHVLPPEPPKPEKETNKNPDPEPEEKEEKKDKGNSSTPANTTIETEEAVTVVLHSGLDSLASSTILGPIAFCVVVWMAVLT